MTMSVAWLWLLLAPCAPAQELLKGEFGDIDLGRQLLEPARFPTVKQLRRAAQNPSIETVLMIKLYGDQNNHHLPIWSQDGQRLAFQRSKVQASSSKILLFDAMSRPAPILLSGGPDEYDYMFRWGVNSPGGYAFSRIKADEQNTHVYFSADGTKPLPKTSGPGQNQYPTLYERTDGIWRLVYERGGRLIHEAFNADDRIEAPFELAAGTSPRWSRDGYRLLFLRERARSTRLAAMDVVVRNLRTEIDVLLQTPRVGLIRSPVWSPDEQSVAFYMQEPGDSQPWNIQVCSVSPEATARTIAADVIVNPDFKSEGPSWEPSGRRIWYFSQRHRQQAYYPLAAAAVGSEENIVVQYPRRCTTPGDVAVNPVTQVPEIAFVGHDGLPRDLFIVFLNHY